MLEVPPSWPLRSSRSCTRRHFARQISETQDAPAPMTIRTRAAEIGLSERRRRGTRRLDGGPFGDGTALMRRHQISPLLCSRALERLGFPRTDAGELLRPRTRSAADSSRRYLLPCPGSRRGPALWRHAPHLEASAFMRRARVRGCAPGLRKRRAGPRMRCFSAAVASAAGWPSPQLPSRLHGAVVGRGHSLLGERGTWPLPAAHSHRLSPAAVASLGATPPRMRRRPPPPWQCAACSAPPPLVADDQAAAAARLAASRRARNPITHLPHTWPRTTLGPRARRRPRSFPRPATAERGRVGPDHLDERGPASSWPPSPRSPQSPLPAPRSVRLDAPARAARDGPFPNAGHLSQRARGPTLGVDPGAGAGGRCARLRGRGRRVRRAQTPAAPPPSRALRIGLSRRCSTATFPERRTPPTTPKAAPRPLTKDMR